MHVRNFTGITDAICFVDDQGTRSKLICAMQCEGDTDYADLKSYLQQHLPRYMVPMSFYTVDTFPYNKNGKIDRQKVVEDYHLVGVA